MLLDPFKPVVRMYMAMIQSWYPILDDCMPVPCLTEEYFLQSLQRWGIVGWEARSLTFFDPQRTHTMPSGQRFSMNHYSVGVVREHLEQLLGSYPSRSSCSVPSVAAPCDVSAAVADCLVENEFRFERFERLAGRSGRGWKVDFHVRAESRRSLVQVLSTGIVRQRTACQRTC